MPPSKYDQYINKNKSGGKKIPPDKVKSWVERNFDFKTRKNGTEFLICNPLSGDTGFNFNINVDNTYCHCWTGNEWAGPVNPASGKRNCSFLNFVKIYKKCSYAEAVRDVLGASGDFKSYLRPENRHSTAEVTRKIAVALPDGTERLADSDDKQADIIRNWLKSRGYCDADIDKYDIHYLAMDCFWPYYEFDTLVYWQSRNRFNKIFRFPDITIYDKQGEVVGETDGSKGDFLYGFDECENASFVTITESIFGQYTLGDQALASGGAILTEAQIGKLKIIGPRSAIILSPDNDAAGRLSIISNSKSLKDCGCRLCFSIPPKIEYFENGLRKVTKDWNELVTKLRISRAKVRELHNELIIKIDASSIQKLIDSLSVKDRKKMGYG